MEWLDTYLTEASDLLGKLYGIPGGVLVLISCLVIGYVLRVIRRFPNSAIPLVVILWGPVFNMLIADPKADTFPLRLWLVKNFLVGVVLGGVAWTIHNKALKKLEEKLPFLKGWLVPGSTDTNPRAFVKSDFPDGQPLIPPKEIKT